MQVITQVFTNKTSTGNSTVVQALGAAYVTAQMNITGTGPSATIQLQGSLDGSNWDNIGSAATVTSTSFVYKTEIQVYRYYQLNMSAISGTSPSVNAWIAAIGPALSSY